MVPPQTENTNPPKASKAAGGLSGRKIAQTLIRTRQERFQGPIPPPDALKAYGGIDPAFPDRIIKMAESHVRSDVHRKDVDSVSIVLGQVFSFLLGSISIGAGVLLALRGATAAAITAVVGGFAPVIIAALSNFKKK